MGQGGEKKTGCISLVGNNDRFRLQEKFSPYTKLNDAAMNLSPPTHLYRWVVEYVRRQF